MCNYLSLYMHFILPCGSFMRHKIDSDSNHLIMITNPLFFHFIFSISILFPSIYALNQDGTTLLSFKQYLHSYPPSVFQNWNHTQATPCSWSGVTCAPQTGSVIRLDLPNSRLIGSIPDDISRLEHLRVLDLSNNSINGTLPISLLNISNLQTLALSYNFISGGLPDMFNMFHNLRVLNLSHNYLSGRVSGGFDTIEVLDVSYNMFDRNLPLDFGGFSLNYLNLSHNNIPGSVSPEFASKIPERAIVDLSFNNFTGQIPQTLLLLSNTKAEYFAGNLELCGKPLKKMCTVPSSHSLPPNVSLEYPSTAAIAAIPKTARKSNDHGGGKVDIGKVVAIVVGDAAAVVLFVVLFFYAYRIRKKKTNQNMKVILPIKIGESTSTYSPVHSRCCFIGGMEEETSETSTEYESVGSNDNNNNNKCLVMVDGETELEMETLLKASAYILGSSGGSIVYKAVVVRSGGGDGGVQAFAVRRIAKCGVEKMMEFEKIVRVLGKVRHPNLVKVRGFYWGEEEKLLICDYVSGGSLAGSAAYTKASSSSCRLSLEVRLKIAKGIAKGISYIHEKKHVHGNIKPSNILLTSEMDALISDFGLEWLVSGQKSYMTDKSTRNFVSKRATSSIKETLIHGDHQNSNNSNTYVAPSTSLHECTSPYQAPESMKTLKPNPKWDVYSFGIILLELFSGKMLSTKELAHWSTDLSISNNETKILEIIDGFTAIDVHEQKDCLLTCFKLGFYCTSFAPQKRPSMKQALQVLEKIPCPS